ncbi:hypothetical protein EYF80_039712 [Liparis tanakae]|uniref:Uncharacterized protein n=1 Tax=Liparis tanakae TaxID=230148 RepID=A0A4Z2G988_9TELE|nr:hypothetical protein EYF80_039712 [Liparis tanakae]
MDCATLLSPLKYRPRARYPSVFREGRREKEGMTFSKGALVLIEKGAAGSKPRLTWESTPCTGLCGSIGFLFCPLPIRLYPQQT